VGKVPRYDNIPKNWKSKALRDALAVELIKAEEGRNRVTLEKLVEVVD
jgi:hypothetical protein